MAGAVAYGLPTTSGAVSIGSAAAGKPTVVLGLTLAETGGTAAVTAVLRTTGATGKILATVTAAASGGDTHWFGPQGVRCNSGKLYCEKVGTGVLAGSVLIA